MNLLDHCERHPKQVGACQDCYRICLKSMKEAAEQKWGKVGAQKPEPVYKNLPMPPAPPMKARVSDPITSDEGVTHIRQGFSENREKILALDFPASGLNYRQIASLSGIYPTTCSRVITTMFREGSLIRVGKNSAGYLYLPDYACARTAFKRAVGE